MFRAYEPEQDRLVAVKLFRVDLPPERVHQLVAELEALIASDLAHPAIAAPLGAGMSGFSAYLAQDFIAADSLDVVVRDSGAAAPADVVRVALQLASALDFAAAAETLHGALHPRDLLLSADDVRMTGLGVSRALERVGVSVPVRRPYTAPERAAGQTWDRRADVFSLAALMFELLCAKRVSGVGNQAADAMPDVAGADRSDARRVFARALAEDPADRFESAGAFAEALQMAFGEMPTLAPTRGRARRRTLAAPTQGELALPLDASDLDRDDRRRTPDAAPDVALEPAAAPEAPVVEPDLDLRIDEPMRSAVADEPLAVDVDVSDVLPEPEPEPALVVPSSSASPIADEEEPARRIDHVDLLAAERIDRMEPPAVQIDRLERVGVPSILSEGALETTRSAIWPLMLALMVGIAIGFGIAMAFVARSPDTPTTATAPPPAAAPPIEPTPPVSAPVAPPVVASQPPAPPTAAAPAPAPPSANATAAAPTVPPPAATRPPPPAPIRGTVLVRTTPPGAQVFLDGRRAGTTPVTLRDLARGSHGVRLARDGYLTVERRVSVTDSRTSQTLAVDLVRARAAVPPSAGPPAGRAPAPQARAGAIAIESRPTGASVFVDGRLVGTTPLVIEDVAVGEHTVRLELATFRPWSSPVTVVGGQRSRVAGSLEQLP